MLKRYTFWFSAAILFQFISGIVHSISLFIAAVPDNETERQMLLLMTTHRMDMGDGFHPTFFNLFTALSACFTFLCIFAALINGHLLLKHTEPNVMKGILAINVAVFGVLFAVTGFLTFSLPIICTGLIFVNLLAAYIVIPKNEPAD